VRGKITTFNISSKNNQALKFRIVPLQHAQSGIC
jgi:hypothetical protein